MGILKTRRTCSIPLMSQMSVIWFDVPLFWVMIQPTRSEQIRCGRVRLTIKGRMTETFDQLGTWRSNIKADSKHEIIAWKMATWLVHQTLKLLPTLLSRELYTPKINFMPRFFFSFNFMCPIFEGICPPVRHGPLDHLQVLAPIPTESDGRGVSWWPSGVGCVSLSRVSLGMYFFNVGIP